MTKAKPITFVCVHCESNDVFADAYAEWNEELQTWEVAARFDKNSCCNKCGGETRLMKKELNNE